MNRFVKRAALSALLFSHPFFFTPSVAQAQSKTSPAAGTSIAAAAPAQDTPGSIAPLLLNRQIAERDIISTYKDPEYKGVTSWSNIAPMPNNPVYETAAFLHVSFSEAAFHPTRAPNGSLYYNYPAINFLNPAFEHNVKDFYALNFAVGKTDFASVTNKELYPKLLQAIQDNIKNGISVHFTGGASRTHDNQSSTAQARTDSLRNVDLANRRANMLAAKVRTDLLTLGWPAEKLDRLLKTDVDAFGDQKLVVNKTGAVTENQYVQVDLSGQRDRKYYYHIFVADPQTAASVYRLYATELAARIPAHGYMINCSSDANPLELGNEIRLTDVDQYKNPIILDVRAADTRKLTCVVDGQKGLPDGSFTQTRTAQGLDLKYNNQTIMTLRIMNAQDNTAPPDPALMPRMMISDSAGNLHPIQMGANLSTYLPQAVRHNPAPSRGAPMASRSASGATQDMTP